MIEQFNKTVKIKNLFFIILTEHCLVRNKYQFSQPIETFEFYLMQWQNIQRSKRFDRVTFRVASQYILPLNHQDTGNR